MKSHGNELTPMRGGRKWGPIHDTILFYSKSNNYTWNRTYQTYSQDYIDAYYKMEDEHRSFSTRVPDGFRYSGMVILDSRGGA